MTNPNVCSFAIQIKDRVRDRPRKNPPWGLCVHTTGKGIVARAQREGINLCDSKALAEFIADYYAGAQFSAHYLGAWDGTLYQITHDDRRVSHIGVTERERALMLSERWKKRVPKQALKLWQERWPGKKSPQHLFHSPYPNDDFIGLELVPTVHPQRGGLWFTEEQHVLCAKLFLDRQSAHGWGDQKARLLGHEDVDPFGRWQSKGGWDPGGLRRRPRFDWTLVESVTATLAAA